MRSLGSGKDDTIARRRPERLIYPRDTKVAIATGFQSGRSAELKGPFEFELKATGNTKLVQ